MNRLLNNSDDKHSSASHQYEISSMISRLRNVKNLSIIDLSKQASVDIKFIEDVETGVYNDCFDQITRIIEQLGYKMDFVKTSNIKSLVFSNIDRNDKIGDLCKDLSGDMFFCNLEDENKRREYIISIGYKYFITQSAIKLFFKEFLGENIDFDKD